MKINYKKIAIFIILLLCCFTVVSADDIVIPSGELTQCDEIMGPNLTKIVKASIITLQIVAAIIAILKGMMTLIPPIMAKDAEALKKSSKTLVTIAIILMIVFLFRPLLSFIGNLLDFDTSCIL